MAYFIHHPEKQKQIWELNAALNALSSCNKEACSELSENILDFRRGHFKQGEVDLVIILDSIFKNINRDKEDLELIFKCRRELLEYLSTYEVTSIEDALLFEQALAPCPYDSVGIGRLLLYITKAIRVAAMPITNVADYTVTENYNGGLTHRHVVQAYLGGVNIFFYEDDKGKQDIYKIPSDYQFYALSAKDKEHDLILAVFELLEAKEKLFSVLFSSLRVSTGRIHTCKAPCFFGKVVLLYKFPTEKFFIRALITEIHECISEITKN